MKRTISLIMMLLALFTSMNAQTVQITGTVTSAEDHEPLIGASVIVLGTKTAASTDIDGNYSINVQVGQTLQFSYVGCNTEQHKVTGAGAINIELKTDEIMLDEVVAIGYGVTKKSDLTGSVSSVASDKLQKTPAPSLANALQGQAAGVTVNSLSGRPGAAAEVRIRGVGTTNNASPIYVVDGVITDDIGFLSPNDIERTEILKDASATAIYGSRGANGVIIVTTRTGRKNERAHITFDSYIGFQKRWKKMDVMNAQEFIDAYVNINGTASSKKFYAENGMNKWLGVFQALRSSDYYPTIYDPETNPTGINYEVIDTDWQDEVFRTAMIQNYHLSLDGGTDKMTYSTSVSWFRQEGTVIGSEFSRVTARLNTSYQAMPWLKIGENITFAASTAQNAYESGDNIESPGANILSAALAMAPWDPVRYPQGSVNRKGTDMSGRIAAGSNFKNVTNPFSMVEYSHPKVRNERWLGNVYAELTPIKDLMWRTTFNFDYRLTTNRSFSDKYTVSAYDHRDKNFIASDMARVYYYNVDNILTYNKDFGKHHIGLMAGQTVEQYEYYSVGGSGASILNPDEKNWFLNQATEDFSKPGDNVARNRRFSWLGRVQYNYADKYLLTVNFRADGSSKFPEKKWGYFPSFALAWRISQESFMGPSKSWLNDLKLRFGWGKVGNDNIGNDAFTLNMSTPGPQFVGYVFGQQQAVVNGAAVLTWINNGGHWENTEQLSAGVDFAMFNNRLTGSLDGFIRNTNDMLMYVNAPAQVGNRFSGMANVGKVRNRGIEIQLEHRNRLGKDFSYSISGNVSFIDNKLTELNGGSPVLGGYAQNQIVDKDHSLYYFNGYKYLGIYQSDEEVLTHLHGYTAETTPYHAGDAIYQDTDGNGVIDWDDRVEIGKSIPWLNYGINLGAYWKDFDLQVFFQGVGGNKIYNQMRHRLEGDGTQSVISTKMANAWTRDNTAGTIANPKNSVNYEVSDRFLEDGSYFRLKNLQVGYSLPKKLIGKAGFENCRFYIQGSNLFTVTEYSGYDPEVSGVDYGNYPQSRSYLFGVNITY